MNAYRLLRHPLNAARLAVLAGLSIGLCMQQAAADDVVVVSGAEVLAEIRAQREELQAQMRAHVQEYMESLARELSETKDVAVSDAEPARELRLSTIEVSTRG